MTYMTTFENHNILRESTFHWAEKVIVPRAGLPNQGLMKRTMQSIDFAKKNSLRCVLPASY